MVTKLRHGDIVWIDLSPYVNLRVVAKFVDYNKFYKIKENGVCPFDSSLIIYDKFYVESDFSEITFENRNLLCSPYLILWTRYINDNMKVVKRESVLDAEMTLPHLRRIPNDIRYLDDVNDENFRDYFYKIRYNILKADNGVPYLKMEEVDISKCGHLDYDIPVGDPYYVRTRIFIEYLKLNQPSKLDYKLFGKLPEFLENPDNGGNDTFVYNRYAKMPLLKDISEEYWFKTLP